MAVIWTAVSFSYGDTPVLKNVSLTLPDTGCVCLFGASGCGKTTMLRLLAGLERPDSGSMTGLEGKRPAVVFQEDRLLPWLTVRDNVLAPLRGEDAIRRANEALELVGLTEAADKRPVALSGGMRRRAAIARALAVGGDMLLLDEPFTGLDENLWRPLAREIAKRYADRLVVLVTHVPQQAQEMGAAVIRLPSIPVTGRLAWEKSELTLDKPKGIG